MRTQPLSTESIEALVQCLPEESKVIFKLGLATGLRISEVLSIERASIYRQLEAATLTIERHNVKGKKKGRVIPLKPETVAMLKDHLSSTQGLKLFSTSKRTYNRHLKRAALLANVNPQGVSSHATRKTFAKRIYDGSGRDIALTAKTLGHVNIANTVLYLGLDEAKVNEAILKYA